MLQKFIPSTARSRSSASCRYVAKIIKQKLIPPIRLAAELFINQILSPAIDDNKMTRSWNINLHFNITSPLPINSQLNFVGNFIGFVSSFHVADDEEDIRAKVITFVLKTTTSSEL